MTKLTETHETLAEESKWDFSDLNALFINCTLKRSPAVSNTSGLADLAVAIMEPASLQSVQCPRPGQPQRQAKTQPHRNLQ